MNLSPQSHNSRFLRGCFEISVFLKRGFERFDGTPDPFCRSLLIPYLLLPLSLLAAVPEPEFQGMSVTQVGIALLYRTTMALVFYLGGIWLLTWVLERRALFYKFGTVMNWLNITGAVLMVPYIALIWLGGFEPAELSHLVLVILLLFLAIVAFTAHHTLQVNWTLSVLLSVYMMVAEYAAAQMLRL